jgi:vacuolar-type H+-ATPase subunit I/STV1
MPVLTLIGIILSNTPVWVFAILGLLVWLGVQALKPRTLSLGRVVLVPVGFIIWGLSNLFSGPLPPVELLEIRGLAVLIALGVAWAIPARRGVTIDRVNNTLHVPGSPIPLIRNVALFLTKYVLAVTVAMTGGDPTPRFIDAAISGLISGYFLGWLIRIIVKFRAETSSEAA